MIECDVAVVGSGSAGSVVAGRLAAESSQEVVLVEAGPDHGAFGSGRWPADLLDGGALATSHDWGFTSESLPGRDPIEFQRARVVGGCSSHNGCIAAVGCPADYDGWAAITGDDRWSAAALRPVFARALTRMRVRHYDDTEIGPFHRAALAAAAALGIPRADDLDDLDGGEGFGTEPVNIQRGVRFNAAFAYLDPARERSNLLILDGTLVDRLLPGASGVTVHGSRRGESVEIRAQKVVLCAGTYGTPGILLRSGVGDPAEPQPAGVEVIHELPGVGRNLHDHPLIELEFAGSDELRSRLAEAAEQRFVPEEQTLWKLSSGLGSGPYDLHVMPVASLPHSMFQGRVLIAAAALEPRSRGRLSLRSADPEDAPVIDHGFLTDPDGRDGSVLTAGIERIRELAATEPLRALLGPETIPGHDADFDDALRHFHSHYFHPVGTCAMGNDEPAVCAGNGAVHGLERVFVADCSLMPVVPRANTNIPAVVVGEVVADALLAL